MTERDGSTSLARRYLQRIVALRVKLVIVSLLLASLLLFLVDYFGTERAWAWSGTIPFGELGAATRLLAPRLVTPVLPRADRGTVPASPRTSGRHRS